MGGILSRWQGEDAGVRIAPLGIQLLAHYGAGPAARARSGAGRPDERHRIRPAPAPRLRTPETTKEDDSMNDARFNGTDRYVATGDLAVAVNAAVILGRPLLVKGEPGTGKTMLAVEVARALGRPLIEWHVKSTTKAQQGLYEYDAVARLRGLAARRRPGPRRRQLHRARQAVGGVHVRHPAGGCSSTRSTRRTSSFPTTCCWSSTGWSSSSTRRRRRCAPPPAPS